jgi:hypothetical protein
MDEMSRAGSVVVVVGLVLLVSAALGMDRELVGQATVWTNMEYQTTVPMDLPGGACTIWLEDHPAWPDSPWDMDVTLNRSADDTLWGYYPSATGERRYRDIEGARCFLVSLVYDVPEGEWRISMEQWEWEWGGVQDEVRIYVLSSPGPLVVVVLVGGAIMAAIGISIVAIRKWPGKAK